MRSGGGLQDREGTGGEFMGFEDADLIFTVISEVELASSSDPSRRMHD